ncbi:Uncharacterized protein HZ326_9867 [Fusarium oxysporum f. sp. albedinis]|nr:Uncharacterized protein HZ326_9867 [Fusarium oxysporum f. sp. albedinis]
MTSMVKVWHLIPHPEPWKPWNVHRTILIKPTYKAQKKKKKKKKKGAKSLYHAFVRNDACFLVVQSYVCDWTK